MAEFAVDGVRFGTLLPDTISGSVHDRRLSKATEEVVTAAFVLGRLGLADLEIVTRDQSGKKLERPDLDVRLADGSIVGIEIAQVGPTQRMRHDANIAILEHTIRDLIDNDQTFAEVFGKRYVTVSTSSPLGERDVSSKKQGQAIVAEVEAFIRAGGHLTNGNDDGERGSGYFGRMYPTLHRKGASYYSSPADYGPYFSVMTGGTVNPRPEIDEVLRVLNAHRAAAVDYRTSRTWMLMYLPDSNEIFRGTVKAVENVNPPILPFERVSITDTSWNIVTLT
jgi:hypothetical protein